MAALEHIYKYSHRSDLDSVDGGMRLRLAAETRDNADVQFFQGDVLDPLTTARCLRAVSDLVGTRFYISPRRLAGIREVTNPCQVSNSSS